jgi:hypothetical protein
LYTSVEKSPLIAERIKDGTDPIHFTSPSGLAVLRRSHWLEPLFFYINISSPFGLYFFPFYLNPRHCFTFGIDTE